MFDAGVFRSLRPKGPLEIQEDIETRRERRGRIWILPVEAFLKGLDPGKDFPTPIGEREPGTNRAG